MIDIAPKGYSYVEISRPILNGKEWLSQVREIGKRVLGGEYVASVPELSLADSETEGDIPVLVNKQIPTVEPVLAVTDKNHFNLVLLNRAVEKERASRFKCGYTQGRLAANHIMTHVMVRDDEGATHRAKVPLPGLTTELDRIMEESGVSVQKPSLAFDRIDIVGTAGKDIILGLSPSSRDASYLGIYRQSKKSVDSLGRISTQWNSPLSPWIVTAPFAKVPQEISNHDYELLMGGLYELLPIRLEPDGVVYRSADRS